MRNKILVLLFSSFVVLMFSCKNNFFSGKLDEGVIEYDIEYIEDSKSNPLISLLPTAMSFKFKENNYIAKIEGWMGIFSMAGIYRKSNGTNTAILKIMNEKYYYQSDLNGPAFGFDSMPKMKIVYTDETKEIAGYTCKKATVNFDENPVWKSFDIYWTDEIEVERPNKNNPFDEVKGVIMEYRMSFQKIKMSLKATKVEKIDVLEEEFEIPSDFEKVPREKMEEVISNLM